MKKWIWQVTTGLVLFCSLVVMWRVVPTFSSSALPPRTTSGVGYDPLTPNESDRALALALQAHDALVQSAATDPAAKPTVTVEILSVERYDDAKTDTSKGAQALGQHARRGEVYLYDYTTNSLLRSIVELDSGAIETETYHGVQLPLTVREENWAVQLIHNESELWATLTERYQTITGTALTSPEQLHVKVSLFLGTAMPEQVNDAARRCGEHRCAQVLLFTDERTLLEVMPIVDLSEGRVVQLLSDSWSVPQTEGTAERSGA